MSKTEAIKLNHLNSCFRLEGNSKRRGIDIQKIQVENGFLGTLQLLVVDEKDITIFSKYLNIESEDREIAINEKFALYDHLSVCVQADQVGVPFVATISFN